MRVFLCYAVRYVCSNSAHLHSSLYMEHLIIKVDVGSYFLQHGAFGGPGQKQGFICLQSPGTESL